MTPEVWDDARARIDAAARALLIAVNWPNESVGERPDPPTMWIDIEAAAESSNDIEIAGTMWDEQGQIYIHLMVPVGTGVREGFRVRMLLSDAFLGVTDGPEGLSYRNGRSFDLMGPPGDDGVYRRLTLIVRYHYQSVLVKPET